MLGTDITTSAQVDAVGRQLFREQWGGVYTRDLLPTAQPNGTRVYVVNTVAATGPQTGHWIGVLDTAGSRYFHDSLGTLGRPQRQALAKRFPRAALAEDDAEQLPSATDCAVHAMAALTVGLARGPDAFLSL